VHRTCDGARRETLRGGVIRSGKDRAAAPHLELGDRLMLHVGLASMLLCLMTTDGPALQAVVQTARQDILADKLRDTVNFDGFDDPKLTLQDALEYLTDRFDLTFDVDERAFARAGEKRALASEIVKERPIPKMRGVSLDGVLDKILSR